MPPLLANHGSSDPVEQEMRLTKRNHTIRRVIAGILTLSFSAGTAFAAGPALVGGNLPYNGDGFGGFTIDNAAFDRTDVTAAPCPIGATCTNSTATSASENFLVREVDVAGFRYIQTIFAESDPVDGDFIFESAVTPESMTVLGDPVDDSIGSKQIIDVPDTGDGSFFASHMFFRGYDLFGNGDTGPSMVMQQIVDNFQTFNYEGLIPGAETAVDAAVYRTQIFQDGAGEMPDFAHVLLSGFYSPAPPGSVTIGAQVLTYGPLRDHMTATWIGSAMSGGGPGVILAPGQVSNHDTRPAADRDFGLLIYRNFDGGQSTGNAGGTPAGLVSPQFTQSTPSKGEIRGFSLQSDENDSGLMYNAGHGAFVGGADILADYWNATVFGPNPY